MSTNPGVTSIPPASISSAGCAEPAPDRRNPPVPHRDLGRERLGAGAVHHGPAAHDRELSTPLSLLQKLWSVDEEIGA